MNKRTLALAAGALLFTGGTTVYASSNSEAGNQKDSGYILEENTTGRNQNERDNFYDEDYDAFRENMENHHREVHSSQAEFEDHHHNSEYGMMGSRKNSRFGSHCGFRR